MKIAIHHNTWASSFSKFWIEYCIEQGIEYKIVDCFSSSLMADLTDCDALMWHHSHGTFKDVLAAKKILFAVEHSGKKVFPDFRTGWHFDDKVAQKYLLEGISAPLVPSVVFYDKESAINWAERCKYPIVFKLKGGSGSKNVQMVPTVKDARRLIKKAFSKGFSPFNRRNNFNYNIQKFYKERKLKPLLKAFGGLVVKSEFGKMQSNDKGYIYFQEFIANNRTDFRLKVVDGKCWGFQRRVREGDFRASGSGEYLFDNSLIPISMIKIALDCSEKLGLQSVAFDFVLNEGQPLIVEISYCFGIDKDMIQFSYGYWDRNLTFHEGRFNPFGWMVENLIKEIK